MGNSLEVQGLGPHDFTSKGPVVQKKYKQNIKQTNFQMYNIMIWYL